MILSNPVLGLVSAIWVYHVVKKRGGFPLVWVLCGFFMWAVFALVVGIRYRDAGLRWFGAIGLALFAWIVAVTSKAGRFPAARSRVAPYSPSLRMPVSRQEPPSRR